MNTHIASKCSKPPGYKICSKCSSTNNTWSNCTSEVVKCINCGGPHEKRSPSCPTVKELLKVNQHSSPKFVFSENDFPCLSKIYPQTNASSSREEEKPRTTTHEKFEKYAAVDLSYKAMLCFGVALSASSGDRNRLNKNMLKLLEENDIPKVYVITIN